MTNASEDAPVIDRADGVCLWDADGRRYIDGTSSGGGTVHCHRHPAIDIAIRDQMDRVAHTTLDHEPALELARRLTSLAPEGLRRVVFSDCRQMAMERAREMAVAYWRGRRTGFVTAADAADLEQIMRRDQTADPAAVIVEPRAGDARAVRELCDAHGVLMIADESATGFGRTGRMFACDHDGVAPDLMVLAGGLAGGYLPLAATLAGERIPPFDHACSGNALACAAALASLNVFDQEKTIELLQPKIALLEKLLRPIAAIESVREVRQHGLIVEIELEGFPADARTGRQVAIEARRRGAIVDARGDVVVLMPPLGIDHHQLRRLGDVVCRSIESATGAAAADDDLAEAA